MSYYVCYRDDGGRDLLLSEEATVMAAVVSALDYARDYASGEFYVKDGGGTVVKFQCYPDGDTIRVVPNFVFE